MRNAIRSNRGTSMNARGRFRLEHEPVLRTGGGLSRHVEALVDGVRNLRDGGHVRFARARAVEDLFLDVYLPQLRLWDAATNRGAGWKHDDPRSAMRDSLENVIAGVLGIESTSVFCAGLAFLPYNNKKED